MTFVIPEPPRATIPVEGSHELFPVRRIFCVGRNYAEHAYQQIPMGFGDADSAVHEGATHASHGATCEGVQTYWSSKYSRVPRPVA
jgi:hypothetical protein